MLAGLLCVGRGLIARLSCAFAAVHARVQAKNAISQLSDTELMGRPILVREDRGDSGQHGRGVGGSAGEKVYVGNLSWEVQWQDLKDHMRTVREICST